MKKTLLLVLVLLLSQGVLKSQTDKNMWLKNVDPKLLEKVDMTKIPNAPNKLNASGKREGDWVIWLSKSHDETSNPDFIYLYRKLNYKSGVVKGKIEDYYLDGKLSATGQIENDKFEGEVKYYNPDGTKEKTQNFKNGMLNGAWINYGDKEIVVVKGEYTDGKRSGKWEGYHSNRKKKFGGEYADNDKSFAWTFWDEAGKIESMKLYNKGVDISPNEAIVVIDNMIVSGDLVTAEKMTNGYKAVAKSAFGAESSEYLNGLYLDSKLLITKNEDGKAIEVLTSLVNNNKVSEIVYHKSLFDLNNLYKKAGNTDGSIDVLNKLLLRLEKSKPVLPFEKTLAQDELAEIYLKKKENTNLSLVLQKVDFTEWEQLLGQQNGALEVIKKYFNNDKINDFNVLSSDEIYLFDARIVELAYKDVLLAESTQIEQNALMQKVGRLLNLNSFMGSIGTLLKQFNPKNEVVLLDKSIMESLSKKYGFKLRQE